MKPFLVVMNSWCSKLILQGITKLKTLDRHSFMSNNLKKDTCLVLFSFFYSEPTEPE